MPTASASPARSVSLIPSIRQQLFPKRNEIMPDRDGTKHDVLSAQEAMLRLAERDYGLTAKRLHAETKIPLSTIMSWKRATAPACMSLADFVAICRVIPDDLTTLCMEPAGKSVGDCATTDLDELATHAGDYAHEYQKARHPASPGGTTIVPQEAAQLHEIRRRIGAVAS